MAAIQACQNHERTSTRLFPAFIAFVSLFLTGAVRPAEGQPAATEPETSESQPQSVELTLNFQDAPLRAVLEYLSETAGLSVVADEPLDARITVISRQPLSVEAALSLINSILRERDFAAVRTGNTLRIVSLSDARTMNIPVTSGSDPAAITPSDEVVTHVVPVRYVSAASLRENLAALVPEQATLEANEDGNALIITDSMANIRRLMEIVQALDTHMAAVAEIRVFRLTSAEATSVASVINSLFQQQATGASGGRDRRGGPFEMMMRMRGRGRGGDDDDDTPAGGAVNAPVVAAADERTNSVVVRGPGEALRIVADVVLALDDKTANVADVRVYHLKHADADNVATLVNEIFAEGGSSRSNERGGRFFRGPFGPPPEGAQQAEGRSAVQVTAAADDRTNTVVVTGPTDILEVVSSVIENLDSPSPDVADVKVFHLEYADADNAAELINEVFGQDRTSSRQSSSRQNMQIAFRRGGPFGGGDAAGGETSGGLNVVVVAAADERTNSVVVSGPAETLAIIAEVIRELDENPEQERQIFVYTCKNSDAENLMTILNNLFIEMQNLREQATGGTGSRFQGQAAGPGARQAQAAGMQSSTSSDLDEQAYFEADADTNSLLILTSSKNYEKIRPIIEELDLPVPQVLIKVLFAEVTHSDLVDLGTEFSLVNLQGDGDSTSFATDFGLANASSGLVIGAVEGDLNVTLRALQEVGKLNILSRPYILTGNNQAATITVGAEVPFVTNVRFTETGQAINTIEYQDIGIILEVTPSINREGLVTMTVSPEISETTGETVPIGQGVEAAVFAKRSSEARLAVRDGQTIVIGGLIEDQLKKNVDKVPLLGDIPLVGALFRRTIEEKSKTELLIFLTPHVAAAAEELTEISDAEAARSNLGQGGMGAEVFEQHMDAMRGEED